MRELTRSVRIVLGAVLVTFTLPVLTSAYSDNTTRARCRRRRDGLQWELALILALWTHQAVNALVRPAVKHYSKKWRFPLPVHRRVCLGLCAGRQPARPTNPADPEAAPVAGGYRFVQRVCYVPDLAKYPASELPLPAVELDADSAMCSICYDDFKAPHTLAKRCLKRRGPVSAPTLWKTRCGHVYHESCLLEWFRASGGSVCPYCNQDVAAMAA